MSASPQRLDAFVSGADRMPGLVRTWMRLARFIIRRLLFLIPVLIGAIFITFLLTRIVPGNPIEKVAGPYASDEKVEEMKRDAGLLDPWYVQFWDYLGDLAHGDMGTSYQTNQAVATDL